MLLGSVSACDEPCYSVQVEVTARRHSNTKNLLKKIPSLAHSLDAKVKMLNACSSLLLEECTPECQGA